MPIGKGDKAVKLTYAFLIAVVLLIVLADPLLLVWCVLFYFAFGMVAIAAEKLIGPKKSKDM
ncbi:MAG: hypothetical protein Q8S26_01890 [Azonexus sp.]|nr:hypothetical protein [Azonexus sp.]